MKKWSMNVSIVYKKINAKRVAYGHQTVKYLQLLILSKPGHANILLSLLLSGFKPLHLREAGGGVGGGA